MSDPRTTEQMARAVCESWGIDPDDRSQDRSDDTFLTVNWRRQDVQKHVKAFLACMKAVSYVR